MTADGYDVVSYGAVLPTMLADSGWGLTVPQAGLIGSLTAVGMLVGAMVVGLLTDLVGRRRLVLASVTTFSLAMVLCAIAPGVTMFGIGRLLVGFGVGGVVPSITALVFEYSAPHRRNVHTAVAFAGIGIGGAASAAVAATVVPAFGFRVEFLLGGLAALVILPLAVAFLPESLVYLRAAGREADARSWAARLGIDPDPDPGPAPEPTGAAVAGRFTALFTGGRALMTVSFWMITFVSLLVLFGIFTWLPHLMRSSGYELGSALTFLIVLNMGAAVGPLLVGRMADRVGSKVATAGSFSLAVVGIAVLSHRLPMPMLYVAVVLAGIGTVGAQTLVNVFIASLYPVQVRATAIGAALSVGRLGAILGPLYGSLLLSTGLPVQGLFAAFAAPALIGAVLVTVMPTPSTVADRGPVVSPGASSRSRRVQRRHQP
jgi:AAHS family benzoate transporter-like MFS transporter